MSRNCFRLAIAAIVLASFSSLHAQDHTPRISATLKSANEALADLEWVLKLTSPAEQKQWPVLKDYLDIFLIGVDPARPLRSDIIMGAKIDRYIMSIPVSDFRKFRRDSLFDLGIDIKAVRGDTTLFQCEGTFPREGVGYLRYTNGYATFAEVRDEVPKDLPDPTKEVEQLVSKYDAAVWGRNVAEGQAERRERFQTDRKQLVADLKKLSDESDGDFALRKAFFQASLDEFERVYTEGKELTLGWTMDAGVQKGQLDLQMQPLPETSLDASIKLAGEAPSHFANIARAENSILSGRINTPLDDVRKNYLLSIAAVMRANSKADAQAKEGLNESQKETRGKIADMVFDILEAGINAKIADGFVEAYPGAAGKNTLLFGSRAVDGNKVVDIIKLLPESAPDQKAETDVDREGEVAIHKVTLSTERHPNFVWFFGGPELYVGTKADEVWVAAGENALAELKAAIKKIAEPPTDEGKNRFLTAFAHLGPWVELRDHSAEAEAPKKPAPSRAKKSKKVSGLSDILEEGGSPKLRKMAIEASKPGDDTIDLQLERAGDQAVGSLAANTGILRLIGKVIADFTKENLADE